MACIKIKVTQEDIDEGIQLNSYGCAIGRALQRQYPNINASVGVMVFYLEGYAYESTDEMIKFVRNFDRDKYLTFPTEFVVDLKSAYLPTQSPAYSVA